MVLNPTLALVKHCSSNILRDIPLLYHHKRTIL